MDHNLMRVGSLESTLKKVYFMSTRRYNDYISSSSGSRSSGSSSGTSSSTRFSGPTSSGSSSSENSVRPSSVAHQPDPYDLGNILTWIQSHGYPEGDDGEQQKWIDTLNALKTIDQRKYDRALTLDARQYESPRSQLARLMSLGLGRDAALALLGSGSAGGSATQNTAAPIETDASIFPSETELNDAQTRATSIGAACQIVNTLIGAASFGIQIPGMVASNKVAKASAYMSQKQQTALAALGSISQLSSSAVRAGSLVTDNLKDRDSFVAAMDGLYKADPIYSQAMTELQSNPFGMKFLDDYINQNFNTKRVRTTSDFVDAQTRSALAEYYANELNVEQLYASLDVTKAELARINQEIAQSEQSFPYTLNDLLQGNIRNELQNRQLEQQIEQSEQLFPTQLEISKAQLSAIEQENYIRSWTVKNFELNGENYNTASAIELAIKLNSLNAANTEEAKMAVFDSIINNKKTADCLAYVNLLSAQGASDFLTQHPELQTMIGMVENTDWMTIYQTWLQTKGIKNFAKGVPQNLQTQFQEVVKIAGSAGKDPFNVMWDHISY